VPKQELCLNNFAGSDGEVWTYAKDGREWHRIPRDTCKEGHFYSAEDEHGQMDRRYDEWLTRVEDKAASPYKKLVAGGALSGEDRYHFAIFLGAQVARTRSQRRLAAKSGAWIVQTQLAATASHEGAFNTLVRRLQATGLEQLDEAPVREAVRERLRDMSGYDIAIPKHHILQMMPQLSRELAEVFYGMSWSLTHPRSSYFITSDNPVNLTVDPRAVHPIYGSHRYLNKTAKVSFPLAPKIALLMTHDNHLADLEFEISMHAVAEQNANQAFHAEQEIYAHLEDERVKRLAQQFRNWRPEVELGNIAGSKPLAGVFVPRRWEKRWDNRIKKMAQPQVAPSTGTSAAAQSGGDSRS